MGFTLRDVFLEEWSLPTPVMVMRHGLQTVKVLALASSECLFFCSLLELAAQPLLLPHHCFRPEVCGIDIIWVTVLEGQASTP